MDKQRAIYYRDQLRDARAGVLRDAEGFLEVFFAIERLGAILLERPATLSKYKPRLCELAQRSALAESIPAMYPAFHSSFSRLIDQLQAARNEALHMGAFARHIATHAILTCLILEDALMVGSEHVGDYCVRSPVCAEPWQPLSLVRQQMLSSSFSFLPIRIDLGEGKKWYVVSDLELARVLCNPDRKVTLGTTVCDAVSRFGLKLPEPQTVEVEASIFSVLQHSGGLPILVVDEACNLVGIATPFDLL